MSNKDADAVSRFELGKSSGGQVLVGVAGQQRRADDLHARADLDRRAICQNGDIAELSGVFQRSARQQRVMVAREQEHRHGQRAEYFEGAAHRAFTQRVRVEDVTRNDDELRTVLPGQVSEFLHRAQAGILKTRLSVAVFAVEEPARHSPLKVRGVDEGHVCGVLCRAHALTTTKRPGHRHHNPRTSVRTHWRAGRSPARQLVVQILQIRHRPQLVDVGEGDRLHRLVQQIQVRILDHRGGLRLWQIRQLVARPELL